MEVLDRLHHASFDTTLEAALTGMCDFVDAQCADPSFVDLATSRQFVRETARPVKRCRIVPAHRSCGAQGGTAKTLPRKQPR